MKNVKINYNCVGPDLLFFIFFFVRLLSLLRYIIFRFTDSNPADLKWFPSESYACVLYYVYLDFLEKDECLIVAVTTH